MLQFNHEHCTIADEFIGIGVYCTVLALFSFYVWFYSDNQHAHTKSFLSQRERERERYRENALHNKAR